MKKAILYYTDNVSVADHIGEAVRAQLLKSELPIISVSQQPMDFGHNVCIGDIGRSRVSMTNQVILGLDNTDADVVFLAEHDVLYHPSHFDFEPTGKDTLYFNQNMWRVRTQDGANYKEGWHGAKSQLVGMRFCLMPRWIERLEHFTNVAPLSGLQGFKWYRKKPETISSMLKFGHWESEVGNIDIRHVGNLTGGRKFSIEKSQSIPGWGDPRNRFDEFLKEAIQ